MNRLAAMVCSISLVLPWLSPSLCAQTTNLVAFMSIKKADTYDYRSGNDTGPIAAGTIVVGQVRGDDLVFFGAKQRPLRASAQAFLSVEFIEAKRRNLEASIASANDQLDKIKEDLKHAELLAAVSQPRTSTGTIRDNSGRTYTIQTREDSRPTSSDIGYWKLQYAGATGKLRRLLEEQQAWNPVFLLLDQARPKEK